MVKASQSAQSARIPQTFRKLILQIAAAANQKAPRFPIMNEAKAVALRECEGSFRHGCTPLISWDLVRRPCFLSVRHRRAGLNPCSTRSL